MKEGEQRPHEQAKTEFGQPLTQRQRQRTLFPEGDDLPLFSGTPQQATDSPFIPREVPLKQQELPGMPDIDYEVVRAKDRALRRRRRRTR